ncbi:polysaccharide biosynthesis/export family protein [Zavarzinella formosa]|uniref:polysaccharide biosynthesis/export family protein n=1 Tax=Zavarzinella formosa TaxID=360055 RepID=UPI0002DB0805|nr:polysaccharide biosynthesis/export family protein [Zavarzinella formosa]
MRVRGRHRSCLITSLMLACLANIGCLGGYHAPDAQTFVAPPAVIPSELSKISLPPYVVEPPDILLIEVYTLPQTKGQPATVLSPQPIGGQHLIRPDGTVNLGIWGSLPVSGLTTDQIRDNVRKHIFNQMKTLPFIKEKGTEVDDPDKLFVVVDVIAYNSKAYYIITDGAGYGEQIYRFPSQGYETVIDALSNINGIPLVGSRNNIWVARRTPYAGQPDQILPVDYVALTQQGVTTTNYQILPGDRIYVKAEKIFAVDGFLQKFLTPVERVLGVTLLGSSTYNSITNRTLNTNNASR